MTKDGFIELTRQMRELQREYFRTKDLTVLRKCKTIESQVDSEIRMLQGLAL
jgi:hypothetical protein